MSILCILMIPMNPMYLLCILYYILLSQKVDQIGHGARYSLKLKKKTKRKASTTY